MQSITILNVVNNTIIEKIKVQIGSINLYYGLNFIIIAAINNNID